jgi:hypothetical protein
MDAAGRARSAADAARERYEHQPATGGGLEWIRHLISYGGRVGGGMQIPVADLDGDGDLVCAGKSGLFLLENLTVRAPSTR